MSRREGLESREGVPTGSEPRRLATEANGERYEGTYPTRTNQTTLPRPFRLKEKKYAGAASLWPMGWERRGVCCHEGGVDGFVGA